MSLGSDQLSTDLVLGATSYPDLVGPNNFIVTISITGETHTITFTTLIDFLCPTTPSLEQTVFVDTDSPSASPFIYDLAGEGSSQPFTVSTYAATPTSCNFIM